MSVELITARLKLRPPRAEDLSAWTAMAGDPELTRYVGGPVAPPLVWRALAGQAGSWSLLGYGLFSIESLADGRWLGVAGPVYPPGWPLREVGWRLAANAIGKGYATEAAAAAMDWCVGALGWSSVSHPIHPENAASIRVAERLGAVPAGWIDMPPPFDGAPSAVWSQTAEAWRANPLSKLGRR